MKYIFTLILVAAATLSYSQGEVLIKTVRVPTYSKVESDARFWKWGGSSTLPGYQSTIGTLSNASVRFISNGLERFIIDSVGNLYLIGNSTLLIQTIKNSSSTGRSALKLENNTTKGATFFVYGSDWVPQTAYDRPNSLLMRSQVEMQNGVAIAAGSGPVRFFNSVKTTMLIDSVGNLVVGDSTAEAIVDIKSTTDGILIPRMNRTQFNAIAAKQGKLAYSTTLDKFIYNTGSGAKVLLDSATADAKFGGLRKVLPDADYTLTSSDNTVILLTPAATRTLTLPAASTMANKEFWIVCRAGTTGDWILSGSFVQKGTTGSSLTENFTNSGLVTAQTYHIVSDGSKWYDIND